MAFQHVATKDDGTESLNMDSYEVVLNDSRTPLLALVLRRTLFALGIGLTATFSMVEKIAHVKIHGLLGHGIDVVGGENPAPAASRIDADHPNRNS